MSAFDLFLVAQHQADVTWPTLAQAEVMTQAGQLKTCSGAQDSEVAMAAAHDGPSCIHAPPSCCQTQQPPVSADMDATTQEKPL